ncbi:uncharacterized protein LOC143042006 [Mytilus galloprovincialis]|uniref:uncharacterized protein LOC143042006 n=1 Tax=Mytilus galloprovincialis TaxID=29158 RepID=UPI0039EF4EFE
MGKTVRMSQRPSKSPYAAKKRLRSSAQQSDEVIYQRVQPRDVPAQLGNGSSNVAGQPTSTQVSAQMTPELRNEVIQTVNALVHSPATVTSPDSINESQQLNTGITPNILPVYSVNDNLGLNVSQQTQDKIINGEYVDLSILLTNASTEQSSSLTLDTNGQLVIQAKPSKKITDISTWIDAFLIYTSIYVGVHLEDTQTILKYMYSVKLGASRSIGLGWKDYDQQFRLKKARNPALSWATVDQELWLLYIHTGQSTAPSSGVNMVNTYRKCYEYNNKGACMLPQCRYIHKCLKCNGSHPAINCRVPQNGTGSRRGNFRPFNRTNFRQTGSGTDAGRQIPFIRNT